MPEYRRAYQPGGTFFFTIVTYDRRPIFTDPANVELLRRAVSSVRDESPFEFVAGVILPDHLHSLWTLPAGDPDYSTRIGKIKARFTRSFECAGPVTRSASRQRHRESDVWQRRFWEHAIRDERDLEHHFDYLHYNPVKHGLSTCPHTWPASSFSRWVTRGVYPNDWCCACRGGRVVPPYPSDLDSMVGE